MKKLTLALLLLIPLYSIGQSINCDDLLDEIKFNEGSSLDISCRADSSAIHCISWYKYNNSFFAIVQFKRYGKEYIYGGWKYDFDSYYNLKTEFEESESAGEFFNKYIRNFTISCS